MSIDSHIQLPNGILKHFRNKDGKVWYYDIESQKIGLTGSKKLGISHGYFSDEMEAFLSAEIESPITNICSQIRLFATGKISSLTLTSKDKSIIINYLKSAMSRSLIAKESFLSSSTTAALCPDQLNNDDLVYFSVIGSKETTKYFSTHELGIIVNKTKRKFVVPRNCFYTASTNGIVFILMPISPICAIALFPPEYSNNKIHGEIIRHITIDSEEDIAFLNMRALLYEYIYNNTFVASSDRNELEILKTYFLKNKEKFEKTKTKFLSHYFQE